MDIPCFDDRFMCADDFIYIVKVKEGDKIYKHEFTYKDTAVSIAEYEKSNGKSVAIYKYRPGKEILVPEEEW